MQLTTDLYKYNSSIFTTTNYLFMNILITGSNGQLGSEFKKLVDSYTNFSFIFIDKEDLDITDSSLVFKYFRKNNFDFCINTAAYTAVDKAKTDKENACKVNTQAVQYLQKACDRYGVKLIHISTDFVFDGKQNIPYKETDNANPINVYGESKLGGEQKALVNNNALVIRTSWLYSSFGNNFVKTMIRLGNEKGELSIIDDQIGTPTYAKDLAEMIMELISIQDKNKLRGLYHFSNSGKASWHDFAKEIFRLKNITCKVIPIPTTAYPTPAARPKFSLMDKSKIINDFAIELKDWKESLKECLELL